MSELTTIETIPQEHQGMMNLALILSKSNLVPKLNKQERYNAADIFVLASIGAQLGLNPMTAITNIYIVEGRPTMSARLQRGMLMKHGHGFKVLEWTSQKIKVMANRKGEEPQEFEYTIAEAQHAGLVQRSQAWKAHPRRMLLAAVTRNVVEVLFSDMFLGVSTDDSSDPNSGPSGVFEQLEASAVASGNEPKKLSLSALKTSDIEISETAKEGVNDDNSTQPTNAGLQASAGISEF